MGVTLAVLTYEGSARYSFRPERSTASTPFHLLAVNSIDPDFFYRMSEIIAYSPC